MILEEDYKKDIITLADKFTVPLEIWAFGSRVNGDAHQASDLDLLIKFENKDEKKELRQFKKNLQESNIPILIEVRNWDNIPSYFKENIVANHEIFYSNKQNN
jgi:predicted nucleotidyltransferase